MRVKGIESSSLLIGLGSWLPIISLCFIILKHHIEWIVLAEAAHVKKVLLVLIRVQVVHLPWAPLLHYSQKFNLVVRRVDQLLSDSHGNLGLNVPHVLVLIDNLHAITSHFPAVVLVAVLIWQLLDFLQNQVVKFHKLHSWEWLDIHESEARGELEWTRVFHVLLMIEDSVPDWHCRLLISLLLAHRCRVGHVGVLKV